MKPIEDPDQNDNGLESVNEKSDFSAEKTAEYREQVHLKNDREEVQVSTNLDIALIISQPLIQYRLSCIINLFLQ